MSLTKNIHTYFLKTTLDFCDKEKIEFREFLSERLLDEDDSYEWDGSTWINPRPPQKPHIPRIGNLFWEYVQFYYDQSENAVTPISADCSTEDWNKAANEIYRYKFLSSVERAEEWVALFNSSPALASTAEERVRAAEKRAAAAEARASDAGVRAGVAEARAHDAEARASDAGVRAGVAEARAHAAEARAQGAMLAEARAHDAGVNARSLLRLEEEWSSTRATLIKEVICDLHAIGQSSK
jgi:hypothetical protein